LISEGTTEEADGKDKDKNDITDTESMPYITEEELDSEFKYEILNEPGGENFMRCMQCGTCTASCPVKVIDPDYNCRRIIRMALIGDKNQVLKSKFIWMCSTCYSCYERCPQDVRKFGGLTEVSDFENRVREKHGLPKINQSPEKVQKVLQKVNIKKIIEGDG
jgi:heterodisulfide reductase subunit C